MQTPEFISKDALAALGGTEVVYIREISGADFVAQNVLPTNIRIDPEAVLYSVHAADGSRLAVTDSRSAALAAARDHELQPVSLH
jgi:hypothetical protein